MSAISGVNVRTTEEVLKYDVQVLFGKSMKQSEIIKELLPTARYETEQQIFAQTEDSIGSLEDWLKGLSDG